MTGLYAFSAVPSVPRSHTNFIYDKVTVGGVLVIEECAEALGDVSCRCGGERVGFGLFVCFLAASSLAMADTRLTATSAPTEPNLTDLFVCAQDARITLGKRARSYLHFVSARTPCQSIGSGSFLLFFLRPSSLLTKTFLAIWRHPPL
jgi:hypothetical protein